MIKLIAKKKFIDSHYLEVSTIIKNRIDRVITDNGIYVGKPRKLISLPSKLKTYLLSLKNTLTLKSLINCKPENLEGRIITLQRNQSAIFKKNTNSYKIVYNIFVKSAYHDLDKNVFIDNIGLETCPYCNRNYIYTLEKKDQIKPQVDHFYPKGLYPILAVSYFNLIPSCQPCNGLEAKSENDPTGKGLINPYLIKHSHFKFGYEPYTINILNPISDPSSIKIKFVDKIDGHLNVFKLDKLYNKHKDHVLELIVKSKLKYTKKYREYLHNYKNLTFTDKEIDRMILGNYSTTNEIHKRPLAKLYQDIGKELGLIS